VPDGVSAREAEDFEARLRRAQSVGADAAGTVAPRTVDGKRVIWAPQPGSQSSFLSCPLFEVLYHGTRGPGKRIPDGTLVATDRGWVRAGDVGYGDRLVAADGSFTRIEAIHVGKARPFWRVRFHDGTFVDADDEHRWLSLNSKTGYREGWKVRTTKQLREMVTPCAIPYLSAPMEGTTVWEGPDPYAVGLLLGDGTLRSACVTLYSGQKALIDYMVERHGWKRYQYEDQVERAVCTSRKAGEAWRTVLPRVKAQEKRVPTGLLTAAPADRLAVLQGLLDTDSTIEAGGKMRFGTTSKGMAWDVWHLVHSLGGGASPPRWKATTDRADPDVEQAGYWAVSFRHNNRFTPHRLSEKRLRVRTQRKWLTRGIASIEALPDLHDGVCFAVEHPSHCFVVENYVVTHNSDALLMSFAQHIGRGHRAAWRGILLRRTYPELADIVAKSRKWFGLIFPHAEFNQSKMIWSWPGGEQLLLRHMSQPSDYWHYHGHEYPWIGFEELTTWPSDECYTPMFACCRTSMPGVPRMIRATTNPFGCVPYGDVLTADRGWVAIEDIRPGDSVVSVDARGAARNVKVSGVTHAPYTGDMLHRRGRGITMVFTPGHRFAHMNTAETEHRVKAFADLPGQAIVRRTATSWQGGDDVATIEGFDAGDIMELAGWIISEGNTLRRHCGRAAEKEIHVAQIKPDNRKRIAALLDRLGVRWREGDKGFAICDSRVYALFSSQGYCPEKFVPRDLMTKSEHLLHRLLESLMLGDGCNGVYYTLSRQLADDVAEIATKLGFAVYVSSRLREERKHVCYEVSMSRRSTVQFQTGNHVYDVATTCRSRNIEARPFDGMVYCLTVPGTETFFVRQDDCVWLSGNSGHSWVADRFQLHGQWWKTIVIRDARDPEGRPQPPRAAIHGHLSENKVLLASDPQYAMTISTAASSPAMREAWLTGSWDIVAGGMFDDVWDAQYNVVPPFEVPRSWRLDRALDWGSSHPFSVGWYAQSDGTDITYDDGRQRPTVRGDVFRVDEWYGWTGRPNQGKKMLAVDVAQGIVAREIGRGWRRGQHTRVQPGPADTQIFTTENGVNISVDMRQPVRVDGVLYPGVTWTRADKRPGSRKLGWETMRRLMKHAHPPDVEDQGSVREHPGFFVVGERCPQFLRTVLSLPRDEHDMDDIDDAAEDHVGDEVRYRLRRTGAALRTGTVVGLT